MFALRTTMRSICRNGARGCWFAHEISVQFCRTRCGRQRLQRTACSSGGRTQNVRVDHRGAHIAVSKQFLDARNVHS